MDKLSAFVKLFLVAIFILSSYAVYLPVRLLLKLFRLDTTGWKNAYATFFSTGSAFILNIKMEVVGKQPTPPFFLVSNHLSYVDIVVLYTILDCTFIPKLDVKKWPFLGFMISHMDVIFVDRERKKDVTRVNKLISEALNDKQGVVLFPEGTSTSGRNVLPFKSSLLQFPAATQQPVHYASIRYETGNNDALASENVCFFAGVPFFQHICDFAKNRKTICTVIFGEEVVASNDRKELAQQLHEKVSNLFEPMEQPEELVTAPNG